MKRQAAEKILSQVQSLGADAADIFFRSSASTSLEVKDQKIDAFDRARDRGAGLRVIVRGRLGFAFSTDQSDSALSTLVDAAMANALHTEPDPYQGISRDHNQQYPPVTIYDPEMVRLTEKEKIERVMAMEREAYAVDPRIKRIRKASASFSEAETFILNTNGVAVEYQSTACSSSIEVVAEDRDESQAGSEFDVSRFYNKLMIEEVARKASQRALDLLGARHIDSIKAPAILENAVAQEFLSVMASGFSAENVQKKRSLFTGKLGNNVVSPLITVYDDGLLEGGIGTAPSDDEAVIMKKKTVIEKGRLAMFLYNTYTANKDRTASTGNGMRGGVKGIPGVGITNLYVEPGHSSFDEMVAGVEKGLLVTEVMGMHTANAISGDFSVGAVGFWIERGRKAYPVREITIAGNIIDLMNNVALVGSDLRFSGRIGSPSLLIKELSIGGK